MNYSIEIITLRIGLQHYISVFSDELDQLNVTNVRTDEGQRVYFFGCRYPRNAIPICCTSV